MSAPAGDPVNRINSQRALRYATSALLVLIFIGAARLRFTQIPLVPIHDGDSWGYVGPAISVFTKGHFVQSYRNFPYPGFLYLVLRQFQDFSAIVIVQSCIGLLGGVFLWLAWLKLERFFPERPGVSIVHRILGLPMMAGYLFSANHVLLEHSTRPESIFCTLSALQIWVSLIFIEEALVKKRAVQMCVAGFFMAFQAMFLYFMKPQWGLAMLAALLPLGAAMLVAQRSKWLLASIAALASLAFLTLCWLPEKHLHEKTIPNELSFLHTVLFCVHAKYIYPELVHDAHSSGQAAYDKEFLDEVASGVKAALDNPAGVKVYPTLGFDPQYLFFSGMIDRIKDHFNDSAKCSAFLTHYYLLAWKHQPVEMFCKILREFCLFYHFEGDVTKRLKSKYLLREHFSRSLALIESDTVKSQFGRETPNTYYPRLSAQGESIHMLAETHNWPPMDRYIESVGKLAGSDGFIEQNKIVSILFKIIDNSYLYALVAVTLLAVLSHKSRGFHKATRRFVVSPFPLILWLFTFNLGMTMTSAVILSMKLGRYTQMQFTFTMFSYFAALLAIITVLMERFKIAKEQPGSHTAAKAQLKYRLYRQLPLGKKIMNYRLLLVLSMAFAATTNGMGVAKLRCEYLDRPIGIDAVSPRLSWVLESTGRAQRQTAWRVLVATTSDALASDHGDLWDSGKVANDETIAIVYAGKPLGSGERCYWKVKVWDKDGKESAWSKTATWSMGLLKPEDWKAEWIGYDKPRGEAEAALPATAPDAKIKPTLLPPPAYLRTTFKASKKVTRATVYATGLGIFDLYLNGKRVSDDFFNPGWTSYDKRVHYRTYDVTKFIGNGENAFGAILADGWFSGYVGFAHKRDYYGQHPRVRAQLQLEYADGTSEVIATGSGWKTTTGPLREADFLMGETYDARLSMDGWNNPDFDDSKWDAVNTGMDLQPKVEAHPGLPVRAIAEFKAKKITEPKPGIYVLDLGQNFAGAARLKVKGAPGQKITLRYAERLNPDGTIYTINLRSARAADTYICRGKGVEVWEPRFTFHGFQYIEVTGLTEKPLKDTIVGVALSSDTPIAGSFTCFDPMLNQLHSNIVWTQRMNFIDIPTDCPQRDERLGWTGDAQIYIRTATLNTDVQAFFTKWLMDLEDGQDASGEFPMVAPLKVAGGDGGPAWADAGVICPWTIYEVYGDSRVLEQHYASMTRFIDFCKSRSTPELLPPAKYHSFGDWLSVNADTPKDIIYTAYFAYSTKLTARAAEVLGKAEDAAKYYALFDQIKAAFNKAYVAEDGHIKGDTQTCYVLALAYDLLDDDKAKLAAKYLVENIESHDWHLSTGFIGTKDLMLALTKIGRNDVAFRLVHNDTYPSWGFSIKHGATSIWERWNGWTPDKGFGDPKMNSFAHYSFGAVYQWMVENIGGIRSDGVAYKNIVISPAIDDKLTSAAVTYDSIRGLIKSEWKKKNGKLSLNITIPPNTTAAVYMPAKSRDSVREHDKPDDKVEGVKFLRMENGSSVFNVASGSYEFTAQ